MSDQIIRELWEIKDRIAAEHEYDIDRLFDSLLKSEAEAGRKPVNVPALKAAARKQTKRDE